MATPKFDRIVNEFTRRLGDPASFDASGNLLGTSAGVLTSEEVVAYVNKALFKLINDAWIESEGNKNKFAAIFPELVSLRTIAIPQGENTYNLADPNLDLFVIIDAFTGSDHAHVIDSSDHLLVKHSAYPQYEADDYNPVVSYLGNTIYLFPDYLTKLSPVNLEIIIIKQPLNPNNGSLLVQNGIYDSPFNDQWTSKIAEIAEQLYRIDAQEVA